MTRRDAEQEHRIHFGPLVVTVSCHDRRVSSVLSSSLAAYERAASTVEPDLHVVVGSSHLGLERILRSDHWDFPDGFGARFGHFFTERWQFGGDVPTVIIGVVGSPLYFVRPFLDYEFHTVRQDFGKLLHEHVLVPSIPLLFARNLTLFHAATLANPEGKAVMVTGEGGVGKTSMALELGRRPAWGFLSDDMVILDDAGRVHLNAAWPKVYAYNVEGDPDLEKQLLDGRSIVDRLHWRLLRSRPARVRRSTPPDVLYGELRHSAPLGLVLHIERGDTSELTSAEMAPAEVAQESVRILLSELGRMGCHVRDHIDFRRDRDLPPLGLTWSPSRWAAVAERGVANAQCYRITVPRQMPAVDYRKAMVSLLRELDE